MFLNNVRAHGLYILAIMIVIVARLALIDDADVLLLNTILRSMRAIVTTVGLWLAVFFFYKSIKLKSVFASIDLLRAGPLSRRNAQYAIPAGLAAAFLMNSFANFKASIPMFNTYDIDPLLAEIDRFVHFGYDPWRITETVFGYGRFTWMIDKLYYLWFPAIFIPLAAAIVSPPTVFRHRFLLSFTLVWVFLGVVLATLTASGGPIFYDFYGWRTIFVLATRRRACNGECRLRAQYDIRQGFALGYLFSESQYYGFRNFRDAFHP